MTRGDLGLGVGGVRGVAMRSNSDSESELRKRKTGFLHAKYAHQRSEEICTVAGSEHVGIRKCR